MTTPLYDAHGHTIHAHADHEMTQAEFLTELDTLSDIPEAEFADYSAALHVAWNDSAVITVEGWQLLKGGKYVIHAYADNPYPLKPY